MLQHRQQCSWRMHISRFRHATPLRWLVCGRLTHRLCGCRFYLPGRTRQHAQTKACNAVIQLSSAGLDLDPKPVHLTLRARRSTLGAGTSPPLAEAVWLTGQFRPQHATSQESRPRDTAAVQLFSWGWISHPSGTPLHSGGWYVAASRTGCVAAGSACLAGSAAGCWAPASASAMVLYTCIRAQAHQA